MRRLLLLTLGMTVLLATTQTHAQINAPGHHPHYSVELEPQLLWQWTNAETAVDDGFGFGFRASIPVMQDGPVSTLNNNLTVNFGLLWAIFPECHGWDGCDEHDFWVPVTMQWNFFLTPMFSIFPEFGLGFRDAVFSERVCDDGRCRSSSLRVYPVLWFGGRFYVTDKIALIFRLGTPSLQFGVGFAL